MKSPIIIVLMLLPLPAWARKHQPEICSIRRVMVDVEMLNQGMVEHLTWLKTIPYDESKDQYQQHEADRAREQRAALERDKEELDRRAGVHTVLDAPPLPEPPPLWPDDPDIGVLRMKEEGQTTIYSASGYGGGVATGRTGSDVIYRMTLEDHWGRLVWAGFDDREFSGIMSYADEYSAGANEVGPYRPAAEQRLLKRLAKAAHCGKGKHD